MYISPFSLITIFKCATGEFVSPAAAMTKEGRNPIGNTPILKFSFALIEFEESNVCAEQFRVTNSLSLL